MGDSAKPTSQSDDKTKADGIRADGATEPGNLKAGNCGAMPPVADRGGVERPEGKAMSSQAVEIGSAKGSGGEMLPLQTLSQQEEDLSGQEKTKSPPASSGVPFVVGAESDKPGPGTAARRQGAPGTLGKSLGVMKIPKEWLARMQNK